MLLNFAPIDTSQFVGGGGGGWHVTVLHSLQPTPSDPSHPCNFYTETEHYKTFKLGVGTCGPNAAYGPRLDFLRPAKKLFSSKEKHEIH